MNDRNTVIIGAGPAGLAAALMLAKRGWKNITVLEKRTSASSYEIDKSYSYLIDGRGQKITDLLGLTEKLANLSVPSNEFYLTEIKTDGSTKTKQLPIIDPNRKTAYWLPRKDFLKLLSAEIEQNWQDNITVLFQTKCQEILRKEDKLEIIANNENNETIKFEPDFILGCDGINSIVRQTLAEWDNSEWERFVMKEFPSPSADLKYKVLTLPAKFPVDRDKKELSVSSNAYAIRGLKNTATLPYSLRILPLKNSEEPRNVNIIRKENDPIWNLKNGREVLGFLEKTFPQLPIQEIVTPVEAERFANSKGGKFPKPQYCSGTYFLLENDRGIALLGDAIHSFPPDIGQGVNSALEDVYVLKEALDNSKKKDLYSVLSAYESKRDRDTKALIRLAQIAYPYQYNQDPTAKKLWSVNFMLRLILNKILPFLFSPPAFLMIQNERLRYHEILTKARNTTIILYSSAAVSILILLGFLLNSFTS